jgi:hypothetical protein
LAKSTKTERSESLFREVIFSYIRAQAIADRVLVDVTPTALEAGFRFPVGREDTKVSELFGPREPKRGVFAYPREKVQFRSFGDFRGIFAGLRRLDRGQ